MVLLRRCAGWRPICGTGWHQEMAAAEKAIPSHADLRAATGQHAAMSMPQRCSALRLAALQHSITGTRSGCSRRLWAAMVADVLALLLWETLLCCLS